MLDHQARETISCDYFLDALADPDFAFKVRERNPVDLDSALRIALQLEVWTKDVDRLRNEKRFDERKTRELTKPEPNSDQRMETVVKTNEALRKELAEQRKKIVELEEQMAKSALTIQQTETKTSETNGRSRNFACWGCGDSGHSLSACTKKTMDEKKQLYENHRTVPNSLRPIWEKPNRTCIMVKYKKHRIRALVDTGSDITIAGND